MGQTESRPRARRECPWLGALLALISKPAQEEESLPMPFEHICCARNHEGDAKDFDCTRFTLVETTSKRLAEVWEDFVKLIPKGDEYTKFEATAKSITKGIQKMQVQDSPGNEFMSEFVKFDTLTTRGKTHHMMFSLKPAVGGTVNAAFRFIEAPEGTSPEQLVAYLLKIDAIAANECEKTLKYFSEGFTEDSNASERDTSRLLDDSPAAGSASEEILLSTGASAAAPDVQPGPATKNGTDQSNASADGRPRSPPESANSQHLGKDACLRKLSEPAHIVDSNDAMTTGIQQLSIQNEERISKELTCAEASQFDSPKLVG